MSGAYIINLIIGPIALQAKGVRSQATIERVVAHATGHRVVASAPFDRVVKLIAMEGIGKCRPFKIFDLRSKVDGDLTGCADQGRSRATHKSLVARGQVNGDGLANRRCVNQIQPPTIPNKIRLAGIDRVGVGVAPCARAGAIQILQRREIERAEGRTVLGRIRVVTHHRPSG